MRLRALLAGVLAPVVLWTVLPVGTAAAPSLSSLNHEIQSTEGQIGVTKRSAGGRATSEAALIEGDDRVVELSRMLSGTPDSPRVREAAAELLATAAGTRLKR